MKLVQLVNRFAPDKKYWLNPEWILFVEEASDSGLALVHFLDGTGDLQCMALTISVEGFVEALAKLEE